MPHPKHDHPDRLESLVSELLNELGENPQREGLLRTPHRVAKSLRFLTQGYTQDIDKLVNGAIFHENNNEMVVLKSIDYFSMCEHHLLPFFGKASVAYLPKGKIIGVSKLARIVDVFARRLQVQERLTRQVAETLQRVLDPAGVAVVIEGQHMCMQMRGVEKQNSVMTTSAMLGEFCTNPATRAEFMGLIGGR